MANWQHKVELRDLHEKYENAEILIQEIAKQLKPRLEFLHADINKRKYLGKEIYLDLLQDLIDQFDILSEDPNATVDDYDCILNMLYDFGDINLDNEWNGKKLCWVNNI